MLVRDVSVTDGGFLALLQLSADGLVRVKEVNSGLEDFWKERAKVAQERKNPDLKGELAWCSLLMLVAGSYTNLVPVDDVPDSDFDKEFDAALAELGYSRGIIDLTPRPIQWR
jgi:hypothetical protein